MKRKKKQENKSMQGTSLSRLPESATTHGPFYEIKLAALLALRSRRAGLRFQLYSNVKAACPWDDIVLRVEGVQPVTYLMQLKHARDGGRVSMKNFLSTSKKKYFSLPKYFKLFQDFCKKHEHPESLSDDERMLCSWDMADYRFIMFTNKEVAMPTNLSTGYKGLDFPCEDLLQTGDGTNVLYFNENVEQVWNLFPEEDLFRKEFLPRLRVFGSQAHVEQLEDLMQEEFHALLGKRQSRVKEYVKAYVEKFRLWAEQETSGRCVTESSGEFEAVLAEDLRSRGRRAAGDGALAFQGALSTFWKQQLKKSGSILVRVLGVPRGHRAAKLQQVLDEDFSGRWTYIDDSATSELPVSVLVTVCRTCDVVLMDINKKTQHVRDFVAEVDKEPEVKLIVLGSGTDKDTSYFKGKLKFQEIFEEDWRLEHLTSEAQQNMMGKELNFQGSLLKLEDLQKTWQVQLLQGDVDGALLSSLVNGNTPALGEPPLENDDVVHHARRTLSHSSVLNSRALQLRGEPREHLVLAGFSSDELALLRKHQNEKKQPGKVEGLMKRNTHEMSDDSWTELPIGNESSMMKGWRRACTIYRRHNVHLLENVSGVLLWRATQGDPQAIAECVEPMSSVCRQPYEAKCVHDESAVEAMMGWHGRTCLLLGEPGIGKSCFLASLAARLREESPHHWIVVVKLLKHAELLDSIAHSKESLTRLLAAAAGVIAPGAGAARRCLEAALFHSSAVYVLVDGVDEVSPAHKEKVLQLLDLLLKETRVARVWVASRLELNSALCDILCCAPTSLLPLSRVQQLAYLCARWTVGSDNLSTDAVGRLATEVVDFFAFGHDVNKSSLWLQSEHHDSLKTVALELVRLLCNGCVMISPKQISVLQAETLKVLVNVIIYSRTLAPPLVKLDISTVIERSLNHLKKVLNMDIMHCIYPLSEEKKKNIIEGIQNVICDQTSRKSLLGVPLTLRIVAEVYADTVGSALAIDGRLINGHITQLNLYRQFIFDKRKIFRKRYGINDAIAQHTNILTSGERVFHEMHQSYAMLMWTASRITNCQHEFQEVREKYQKYITTEKTGILWQMEDGRLQFAHYILMEYFVAEWLFEHHENPEEIKPYLLVALQQTRSSKVLFFLDLMLAEGLHLHNAMIEGDADSVTATGGTDVVDCSLDNGKRSALHLAASYGRSDAVVHLFEAGCSVSQRDALFNWTPLQYAGATQELSAAERLLEKGADPIELSNTLDDPRMASCVAQLDLIHVANVMLRTSSRLHLLNGYKHCLTIHPVKSGQQVSSVTVIPLHVAAGAGSIRVAKLILKEGTSVNCCGDDKRTALHAAITGNDKTMVEFLVSHGADVNSRDIDGLSAIHITSWNGNVSIMDYLLNCINGPEINALNDIHLTPVHFAAQNGHEDVMMLLLSKGADVSAKAKTGIMPVHLAALNGHKQTVKILLRHGADIHSRGPGEYTPLHCASCQGHIEVVQLLMSLGAKEKIDAIDNRQFTALHLVAQCGYETVAEILLRNGANVHLTTDTGDTAIHIAAYYGHEFLCKTLLHHGADIHSRGLEKYTPLHYASYQGHTKVVLLLLIMGARDEVNATDNRQFTPLHLAAQSGHADVANLLLDNGADVHRTTDMGDTPMHLAALHDHEVTIKTLWCRGARINSQSMGKCTPLHLASQKGHLKVVQELLSLGAKEDIDCTDQDLFTPLHLATMEGHTKVVNLLLDNRADIQKRTGTGKFLIHLAAQGGHEIILKILLQWGANPNSRDWLNATPLHSASFAGYVNVVRLLVAENADVGSTDNMGQCVLHYAARGGHVDVVKLLIVCGADAHKRDARGLVPFQYAKQHDVQEVLLRESFRRASFDT